MREPENKKYIKLGVTLSAVVVIGLVCYQILAKLPAISGWLAVVGRILRPFLYGAVIAYILAPLCGRIEALGRRWEPLAKRPGLLSGAAILLAILLALALVWLLVMLVIPQVWESVAGLAAAIPGELAAANERLHDLLGSRPELQGYWDEFSSRASAGIAKWLKTDLAPAMETMIDGLGSHIAVFFGLVKDLFLGLLISVYILASRRRFAVQARMLLNGFLPPKWADAAAEEARYADKMFHGFLMGKLLDSAIIGVICFAVTTLLGFSSSALISVVVGVTNIIPFFGPFIGAIPCALLLLLDEPVHCLYFIIFIVVLQQVDGNFIGPRILGNTTGLSSFWVLFSILLFGGLWGVVGMIVGVPLFAVIYDIVCRLTYRGLRRHGREGLVAARADGPGADEAPQTEEKEET